LAEPRAANVLPPVRLRALERRGRQRASERGPLEAERWSDDRNAKLPHLLGPRGGIESKARGGPPTVRPPDLPVVGQPLITHAVPLEVVASRVGVFRELAGESWLLEEEQHVLGDSGVIVTWREQSVLAVRQDGRHAADFRGDDRQSARVRLEHRD